MSTLHTLTDAFAELERRADDASANLPAERAWHTPARHRSGLPMIAASVLAVLVVAAVATGVALVARGGHAAETSAAAPPTPSATAHTSAAPAAFQIPRTPQELARQFRTVLGDTATFTVTDTGTPQKVVVSRVPAGATTTVQRVIPSPRESIGAAIVGTLTASGVTGGFDLQIYRDRPGTAWCDDPDRSRCTVRRLSDGSSLAIGREPLQGAPNAVTYQVNLIRRNGVEFLMHISNERDPKGESSVLAAHPPLTTEQMTAIVTSDRW